MDNIELENTMTLWRYAWRKLLQLGNETGLMQGTYISESHVEKLQSHLALEF